MNIFDTQNNPYKQTTGVVKMPSLKMPSLKYSDIARAPQVFPTTPQPIQPQQTTPLQKATDLFSQQREKQQYFQKQTKKFAASTGIKLVNFFASSLDFTTDLVVRNIDQFISPPDLMTQVIKATPWGQKIRKQWTDYFDEIHKAGTQYGAPLLPTQKLQLAAQKLSQIEYIQPSKKWVDADIKEKLSKEMIGETLFEIGPSIIASMGTFAFGGPTVGIAIIGASTANDVKDSALSYGVEPDKAELLGLSTGILVSALERIVPSKIFAGGFKIKNQFIGGLAKRIAESMLLEAGTEWIQEDIQIFAESTFRDIGYDERTTRKGLAAFGGLMGGGMMQMIGSFANEVQRKEILGDTTIGLTIKEVGPEGVEITPEAQKGIKEAVKPEISITTQDIASEIQQDVIKKIQSKLRNKATIKSITKGEVKVVQTEIIKALEESNLTLNDKAKFIRAIKNVQTIEQLQKRLPDIFTKITELSKAELSRGIQSQINRELKYVKPIKVGQKRIAKYDYQTNKVLEGLRKDNKLTQDQSEIKVASIPTENLSELDKIQARFLSLKANGAKASAILHEQVLADIRYLKETGEIAKDEADFIKRIEKREKIDEISDAINKQKSGIPILRKLQTAYVSSIANLYSTLSTIAGKNIADKYDYGIFQTNSQYDFGRQVDKISNSAKEIYGVKSDRQLTNTFLKDLAPTDWTITDITGLKTEINRFNLIDIYNAIKNDLGKERYNNAFGEEQVNSLLQNLTEEDIKLADLLMEEVQQYKDILNQRSIEITGRDLGEVENYWPSTSEHEVDFYDDIKVQGETPSAMKERSKSSKVIPQISNAWLKFQKHIAQGEHIKTISRKYEELKNIFSNRTIKHTIRNKFGDEAYTALMDHIETMSLNKRTQLLDTFSGVYNTALNNWVKAKIASPTVFVRQLISSVYSLEKVGVKNFLKYQAEAISNPKKAFDYMWKNIPFLSARFKQGYSEALQDAIKGTSELKVGMGSITKYVTILTRGGDVSAIIVNGYPIIKTEMAKHGNMQKAIEEFQKFTEKTQQSGTIANLSRLQRERNALARTFFRFKNTTNQLLRLQTDATIQFVNKQISAEQFATKTALYSIYTPIMYVLMGYMITQGWKKVFGTDDEEKEKSLLGDILAQIIIQPFQALPLLDMAVENAYAEIRKRITGKSYYFGGGMFSYPLLDDIETAWSKIKKKEPTTSDFLRVFSLLQEPVTGIPTETFLRYFGYTQKDKPKSRVPSSGFSGDMMPKMPSLKMEDIMNMKMPSLKF